MSKKFNKYKGYIKIARFDHWIKQFFILPGVALAIAINQNPLTNHKNIIIQIIIALIGTSFVASANYVINEWLDRDFDKFHPVKKNRPAVSKNLIGTFVYLEYFILAIIGLVIGFFVNIECFIVLLILLLMGLIYNVKPVRTKDIPYLDVISESFNNALRLLLGWFAVMPHYFPPASIIVGYWMAGAYLMAIKRYSEFRAINNQKQAGLYRKSFSHYSEIKLLNSSFFYAMLSIFLIGIFLTKYHIEYIIAMPFVCLLFIMYYNLSLKKDSTTQSPEKLIKEKKLIAFCGFLIVLIIILSFVQIPFLNHLMEPFLIKIK